MEYSNNIVTPVSETPSNATINSEGFEIRYSKSFDQNSPHNKSKKPINTNSLALPAKIIDGSKVTSTANTPTGDGILLKYISTTTDNKTDNIPTSENKIISESTLTIESPKTSTINDIITHEPSQEKLPEFSDNNLSKIPVQSMSTYDLL